MSDPKRRFFSGDSLQQALVQAANHYNLNPEEVAYRSVDKRHGFLKVRRKIVIEVDPEAPKRPADEPRAAVETPVEPAPPARSPAPARPAALGGRPGAARGSRERGQRGERRGGEGRRGEPRQRRGGPPRYSREAERQRAGGGDSRHGSGAMPSPMSGESRGPMGAPGASLVSLPDTPRRTAERFPAAVGAQAEAAAKGAELLLRLSGLDLTPRVLQGEERLEVDLQGSDVDWCFADDGELVFALEHLLPRLIRSMSGEGTLVRVDCDNFQEIREERLRSLAQRVAEEVRRRNMPRILEPMNPADRRIVHMTLADDPGVMTESEGDGYFKRITVRPA
jgi:predicted RNA-binding protein Jag